MVVGVSPGDDGDGGEEGGDEPGKGQPHRCGHGERARGQSGASYHLPLQPHAHSTWSEACRICDARGGWGLLDTQVAATAYHLPPTTMRHAAGHLHTYHPPPEFTCNRPSRPPRPATSYHYRLRPTAHSHRQISRSSSTTTTTKMKKEVSPTTYHLPPTHRGRSRAAPPPPPRGEGRGGGR